MVRTMRKLLLLSRELFRQIFDDIKNFINK